MKSALYICITALVVRACCVFISERQDDNDHFLFVLLRKLNYNKIKQLKPVELHYTFT